MAFHVRSEALPLTSCVTLGKSLNLSGPHFPYLKSKDTVSIK